MVLGGLGRGLCPGVVLFGLRVAADQLEHQSLVQRLVPWVVGVPETCLLGVEDDLVTPLWWQGLETPVLVEVVVPVLPVIQGISWRERPVLGHCFFREGHFGRGSRRIMVSPMIAFAVWMVAKA